MSDSKPVVLMIEDDFEILNVNKKWLEKAGFETVLSRSLTETRTALETASPDIVLLDVILPDGDGLVFLPELKSLCDAPVLICSIRNEDKHILDGLEAGGDDYIAKPYNVEILVARVGVMWRLEQKRRDDVRSAMALRSPERIIERGALKLDMLAGRAYLNGADTGLTPKEFALLLFLMQNEGKLMSDEYLYEEIWKLPMNKDNNAIKSAVKRLRKKIAGCGYVITTEYAEGYCLEKEI
jgi:DNA-binding response OmpR family regulator